jgi:hypothetical protein
VQVDASPLSCCSSATNTIRATIAQCVREGVLLVVDMEQDSINFSDKASRQAEVEVCWS